MERPGANFLKMPESVSVWAIPQGGDNDQIFHLRAADGRPAASRISRHEGLCRCLYTFNMERQGKNRVCIDIAGGRAKPGSRVQIYPCKEWIHTNRKNYNQRWTLTALHQIIGHGGLCLDGSDKGGAKGGRITMQRCNGSALQKWTFLYPGNDAAYDWVNVKIEGAKGNCIGVRNGKMKNKTPLVFVDCRRSSYLTFEMRQSRSAQAGDCAKKVQALDKRIMSDIGGVNDYDAEQTCDEENNDVYKVFKTYLTRRLDEYRDHALDQARKRLGR